MKPQELTIKSELFDEFMSNLDIGMRILVNRMIATRIGKGSVNAKIVIEMKEFIDDNGELIRMPEFSYNIGMGMSEKESMKGNMKKGLILKKIGPTRLLIGTDQISMDELIEEKKE